MTVVRVGLTGSNVIHDPLSKMMHFSYGTGLKEIFAQIVAGTFPKFTVGSIRTFNDIYSVFLVSTLPLFEMITGPICAIILKDYHGQIGNKGDQAFHIFSQCINVFVHIASHDTDHDTTRLVS